VVLVPASRRAAALRGLPGARNGFLQRRSAPALTQEGSGDVAGHRPALQPPRWGSLFLKLSLRLFGLERRRIAELENDFAPSPHPTYPRK